MIKFSGEKSFPPTKIQDFFQKNAKLPGNNGIFQVSRLTFWNSYYIIFIREKKLQFQEPDKERTQLFRSAGVCVSMCFRHDLWKKLPGSRAFSVEKRNMGANGQRRENAENIPQTSAVYRKSHPVKRGMKSEGPQIRGWVFWKNSRMLWHPPENGRAAIIPFNGKSFGNRGILTELRKPPLNSVFL